MVSTVQWPAFASTQSPMEQLVALSRYYGSDPEIVLAGGGNTSVKDEQYLYVKGSGSALAVITAEGFVQMRRADLDELLARDLGPERASREEAFKNTIMAARVQPELGQRPSVECVLHNLLPARFIVHSHATVVNKLTCCQGGEALAAEIFGSEIIWVPYVDPGFVLAQALYNKLTEYTKASGRAYPPAVLMANHGLIICGDTPEEIRDNTLMVLEKINARVGEPAAEPFGAISCIEDPAVRSHLIGQIAPALRGLLATEETLKVVCFDDSAPVMALVSGQKGQEVALGGPLCPDQIVYCKSFPLWFEPQAGEDDAACVARLRTAIEQHIKDRRFPPHVVLVKGLGLFAVGNDYKAADTVRQVYIDACKVMAGAAQLKAINFLTPQQYGFIEDWEVESYRQKVAAAGVVRGRATGKIALVTGAAQGFGLEIAQSLAAQGAHVVLADMNVQGAELAAGTLSAQYGAGRALGVAVNVTDEASVQAAIDATVRAYGGLDVLVANAGVVKAGPVRTQPLKDFRFVSDVNYIGYFLCAQKASRPLAIQHLAKPGYLSDIIQINSKSGLEGSNRNGAYAGSKFGGIGLTQSFALELIDDGIKVNSVCPGNFLDGPLWSDPEKGLFVQYLKSGKVPGAKTIEDVKRFYESKVPMRRGCHTADVVAAILYVMEQRYETGQAIPVTGGQVMLN